MEKVVKSIDLSSTLWINFKTPVGFSKKTYDILFRRKLQYFYRINRKFCWLIHYTDASIIIYIQNRQEIVGK